MTPKSELGRMVDIGDTCQRVWTETSLHELVDVQLLVCTFEILLFSSTQYGCILMCTERTIQCYIHYMMRLFTDILVQLFPGQTVTAAQNHHLGSVLLSTVIL